MNDEEQNKLVTCYIEQINVNDEETNILCLCAKRNSWFKLFLFGSKQVGVFKVLKDANFVVGDDVIATFNHNDEIIDVKKIKDLNVK